jgi:hypothetical protein
MDGGLLEAGVPAVAAQPLFPDAIPKRNMGFSMLCHQKSHFVIRLQSATVCNSEAETCKLSLISRL